MKTLLLKSVAGKFFNSVIGLLVILLLPVLVGANDYGKYVVIWGVVVLIGQLSALGLPIIYVRKGVDYLKAKNNDSIKDTNAFSLLSLSTLLPIFFALILLLSEDLGLAFNDYIYIFMSAAFLFLFRLINGYNRGCGEVL